MPGGDGMGPAGMGPMTGRAVGRCAGYPGPGSMNLIPGSGFCGRGRGGGRGRRNWFYATGLTGWQRAAMGQPAFAMSPPYAASCAGSFTPPLMSKDQEVALLKQQAESMANALDEIKKRVEELRAHPQDE